MPKFHQGIYKLKKPEKYKGIDPNNIRYLSQWEKIFMIWCERTSAVVEWASESTHIKYLNVVDKQIHTYIVDFWLKIQYKDKTTKKFLVEIKPFKETQKPVKGTKRQQTFLNEVVTYGRNISKWKAAREYCKAKGYSFIILTENELFKKRKKS